MIFPEDYKTVGVAREYRPGDPIYFATEYMISLEGETVLYRVLRPTEQGVGFMREGRLEEIASGLEIVNYPEIIDTRNRANLIRLAENHSGEGVNTVIFKGPDEHITFVHQADTSAITEIEVMDVAPPNPPWLVYVIGKLEECGVIGDLTVSFRKNVLDLRQVGEEGAYYPCKASGLGKSLDSDRVTEDEPVIVGCEISREIFNATCGCKVHELRNICPISGGLHKPSGPFITRCCKSERRGLTVINGHIGIVVHWGDSPHKVAEAVRCLVNYLRKG
jgi:hypothetical protein